MKLFDKRNIVLIMSIFLLLMMVSSVSAADVSDDAVVGNDAAIDTITSTDMDSGSIDDVISAEVSDNPKANPSDSNESLSGDIVADASSNNDNSNQNTVDDSSQDVLKASSDDEVLEATVTLNVGTGRTYTSLEAALNQLDGYAHYNDDVIIEIDAGTYTGQYNWAQTINGNFNSLIIRAAQGAEVIFDGNHAHRLFTIAHQNVRIEGITFINGNVTSGNDGGVAIHINGAENHIAIDNCKFINNGKTGLFAGAIRVMNGGQGTHDINVTNCYFENNTADVGGGIRSEPGTYGIHIINCTAVNNYGGTHGGFGCLFGDDTVIENCKFENNSAPSSGAVHCHSGNVTVLNCNFTNNHALGGGSNTTNGYAGALGLVYTGSPGVTVIGSNFYNNTAVNDGGAIQVMGTGRDATIRDSEFKDNVAGYGGAIAVKGTYTTIDNVTVTNNTSNGSNAAGGGIYVQGSYTTINNCTVLENKVVGGNGGGIIITQGTATVVNNTILGLNNATGNGGGLHISGGSTFTVSNSTIYNNTATSGAGVYLAGNYVTVDNNDIENNSARQDGAGVYINGQNAIVSNSAVINNNATRNGSGVYINGRYATVRDSTIGNNTAEGSGAGVYIAGQNATVSGSTIENHTAQTSGAGVYIAGNGAIINHTTINNNNATVNGGGAYITGTSARVFNTTFEENNAIPDESKLDDGLGGALFIAGSAGNVTDCDFTHNTARNGSAIYVNPTNPNAYNYINNCEFVENQAWVYWLPILYDNETHKIETNLTGGNNILNAIYNNGSNTRLYINGSYPVLGWENSGNPYGSVPYQDDLENEQEIIILVYDRNGELVFNETRRTNISGTVSVDIPDDTSSWFLINMTHTEDPYYKHITNITAININPGITVSNVTMYEGNQTPQDVVINLLDSTGKPIDNATINVTVIVNGQPISIGSGQTDKNGVLHISEERVFKTLESGNYTIQATYSYLYWNSTTGRNETKTLVGNGTLKVLPYEWDLTKTILEVNGKPYTEGMEIHVYDNITFNITVTNLVDADITSVKITDVDTANLTYVETVGGEWTYEGNNVWSLNNLPANGESSLIVTFLITNNGTSINVANASIFDGKENKSANVTLDATHLVILDITKTVNASEVYVGEEVEFTIVVTNNGQSIAHNANITDVLNNAFKYVSSTPEATVSGQTVKWTGLTINPGESVTVKVVVQVLANGTFNNTAVVKSDETENETNNTTNITVRKVVLDITKTANATEVYVGDNVTFTIVVKNSGDGVAHNANITDVLNDAFAYVSSDPEASVSGQTVTWTGFTINPGANVTVKVVVTVLQNGTFNNTAVVKSDETENETNNTTNITVRKVVLDITKTANATEVYVGENVTFTIVVKNSGDGVAHNANITDVLNDAFAYVSSDPEASVSGQTVTWTGFTINPGANVTVKVVVQVLANGTFNNTAVVKSDETENETNNTTNITVRKVVLDITKTANATEVYVGENVTFTIVVKNSGDGVAHNANITDVLDETFKYVSSDPEATVSGQTIKWTGLTINPGDSVTVKVVVTVLQKGKYNNTAVVKSDETENETNNTTNITVKNVALDITKTANATEVYVGDNVTFTIVVTNNGDGVAHNANITDVLNDAFAYVSSDPEATVSGQTIKWTGFTINPGDSVTVKVVVTVLQNGTFNNTAVVKSDETENETNDTTNITVRKVVLDITKSANATEVYVGENVTFTIVVKNSGDGVAHNANITDVLNDAFAYVSSDPEASVSGQTVTWTGFTINPGANVTVKVVVTVLQNGTFNNTAVVKSDETENETNNTTNITVRKVVLDITKSANATEVYVGENVTFTIVVKNSGDGVAHNANITDVLNDAFAYVSSDPEATVSGQTVKWTGFTINPGDSVTVKVVVTVLQNGTFNNTAVVKSDETENETNNTTNITVRKVVLDITKAVNATEVYVGENVTFTITVTNNGDGVAHNANITDVLNDAFAYVSSDPEASVSGQTVTWTGFTINPGDSVTVKVVVTVLANGTFNNTAVVKCDENETETNNSTNITVRKVVLDITKVGNETEVLVGDEVEFTITVTNKGDGIAHNVVVLDQIPEGFEAADWSGKYTIDSLAPGASETIKIVVVAIKAGEWTNTANTSCTENTTVVEDSADAVIVNRLTLTISVGNYTTTPGTTVPVEITVVDQRGNPVSITLTVVVTGPNATDSLPPHEGKLVFAISTNLGADGDQVTTDSDGKATYEYTVPDTAKDGQSYIVTASSEQTDQYEAAEGTGYIDVIQYNTTTTISDASGKPGETVTLDVEVTTEDGTPFNGDVVITCPDGKKVTVTVKDGKGQFDWTIPEDAKAGDEYQFTATFEGNSTYLASSGNGTVTVEEPEPKPEPPVPVPDPEEPEEPVVTPAKMLNTGNPLVALLAAFVLIGLGLKRREEE